VRPFLEALVGFVCVVVVMMLSSIILGRTIVS
jgi:hypothetical protein